MSEKQGLNTSIADAARALAAFDTLRAEDEPWLDECFITPDEFGLISGTRSVIVYGESGSGKSAVRRALVNQVTPTDSTPTRLVVEWRPAPLGLNLPADSFAVRAQLAQIQDACALALARHLGRYPASFQAAPAWAQDMLTWFVRRSIQGDLTTRIAALLRESSESGRGMLAALTTRAAPEVLGPEAPPELVIKELIPALAALGLNGIWVMVDHVEPWFETEPEHLIRVLMAFLSTLSLFEEPCLSYKLFLPVELESELATVSAVKRRRLDVRRLAWNEEMLVELIERRLAFALQQEQFRLKKLCAAPKLKTWLARVGGSSPRGWLEYTRPLVSAFLQNAGQGKPRPLSKAQWLALYKRNPPKLFFDRKTGRVQVGERTISQLSADEHTLLDYLYQHQGQICTKKSLYLQIYQDQKSSPEIIKPKDYEGLIDTAVWRLRNTIEPVPEEPVFIVTAKGLGLKLLNTV